MAICRTMKACCAPRKYRRRLSSNTVDTNLYRPLLGKRLPIADINDNPVHAAAASLYISALSAPTKPCLSPQTASPLFKSP
jgi:hypothetical protein